MIGELAEAKVMATLMAKGVIVSIPFGERAPYDLIFDNGGTLVRVQCKNGRLRNRRVMFSTCSNHEHRGGIPEDYRGRADVFGVYCAELDSVYLVPVEDCPRRQACLQIDDDAHVGPGRYRLASTYLLQ